MKKYKKLKFALIIFFVLVSFTGRFLYICESQNQEFRQKILDIRKNSGVLSFNAGFKNALSHQARGQVDSSIKDNLASFSSSLIDAIFIVDGSSRKILGAASNNESKFTYSHSRVIFSQLPSFKRSFIVGDFLLVAKHISDLDCYVISVINTASLKNKFQIISFKDIEGNIYPKNFSVIGILNVDLFGFILLFILELILVLGTFFNNKRIEKAVALETEQKVKEKLKLMHKGLKHDFLGIIRPTVDMLKTASKERVYLDRDRLLSILDSAIKHLNWGSRLVHYIGTLIQKNDLKPTMFTLYEILREFKKSSEVIHNRKIIVIDQQNKSLIAFADKEMLYLCLMNLIQNASRHGDRDHKEVTLKVITKGEDIFLSVINKGTIPVDIIDKIFEYGIKSEDSEGMGIGLYHTNKIVKLMGGDIFITSCPVQNEVKVTIKLPIAQIKRKVSS